jgi:hypothetical protein
MLGSIPPLATILNDTDKLKAICEAVTSNVSVSW